MSAAKTVPAIASDSRTLEGFHLLIAISWSDNSYMKSLLFVRRRLAILGEDREPRCPID
jgi:hypothetical protein